MNRAHLFGLFCQSLLELYFEIVFQLFNSLFKTGDSFLHFCKTLKDWWDQKKTIWSINVIVIVVKR